ncbi:hypothetical protein M422DRAFT_777946 [Sphaerobolus stellatus SS14]|uniref:Protein-tyrosine sulfotransferase n=1 Tax=Sphaerobolus stellatus (strain SS14) TaxID=990650 RepID=A0A0C9VWD6_SPHS4|nr:hypothetical protein M422DRAFT_777946 [Sphaerobolus stellatus SS14]
MAGNDLDKIPKIIGLGLGRTGTSSLLIAFESLGIKPAYHMFSIIKRKSKEEFDQWTKIALEGGTVEEIRTLLDPYPVILDYPAAMFPELVYEAYPDAKFILASTVRDPAKWALSVQNTFGKSREQYRTAPSSDPFWQAWYEFVTKIVDEWFHSGVRYTHGAEEFVKHRERVKKAVPADKLLIYEVGEGWDRLTEFIGIGTPTESFPHVNDTAEFQKFIADSLAAKEAAKSG